MSHESEIYSNIRVMVETIKNTIMQNIIYAVNNKQITIEQAKLPGLDLLIRNSVDQAFTNSAKGLNEALKHLTEKIIK